MMFTNCASTPPSSERDSISAGFPTPSSISSASSPPSFQDAYSPELQRWLSLVEMSGMGVDREQRLGHISQLAQAQGVERGFDKGVSVRDVEVPVSTDLDGNPVEESKRPPAAIRVRVYTPEAYTDENGKQWNVGTGPFPLVLHIHGGGWGDVGSVEFEDLTCRQLCKLSRLAVCAPAYRHSRPHGFPTPLQDVYDILLHLSSTASRTVLADPADRGLIISGTSSGAALALAAAFRYNETQASVAAPRLTGLILRAPWCVHPWLAAREKLSLARGHDPLGLRGAEHLEAAWETYCAAPVAPKEERWVAPLLSAADLCKLPRTYVQLCGLDVAYSEGVELVRRLRGAGAEVRVDEWKGMPAEFWGLPRMEGVGECIRRLSCAVSWCEQAAGWASGGPKEELGEWGDADVGQEWSLAWKASEGRSAWKRKKLCMWEGCGCWM